MTAKQAAQHILAGIVTLIKDKREYADSAKRVGADDWNSEYTIAADTLCDVAAALKSAIDEGEYGE